MVTGKRGLPGRACMIVWGEKMMIGLRLGFVRDWVVDCIEFFCDGKWLRWVWEMGVTC